MKFERGEEVKCDILIAADGSRSAVRQQMNFPDDKQQYSGSILSFLFLTSSLFLFICFIIIDMNSICDIIPATHGPPSSEGTDQNTVDHGSGHTIHIKIK